MKATNVSLGRGGTKTVPRTKHLPAPLKLPVRTNSTAPIAAPETASSAPTTPWQLPSTSCLPDQLPKFPVNNELAGLPNKLPKLLKEAQPSTPTRPSCLQQDLVSSASRPAEQIPRDLTTDENETGTTVGSLLVDLPVKESSMASPTMAASTQSDTADLSSLKGIIQV